MKNWTNTNNASFYENMSLTDFNNGIFQGGLDDNCDIKAISSYIKRSNSILEVGAGYGRVLTEIRSNQNYKGELYALEREEKMINLLRTRFENINIIHADLRTFKTKQKFDLILWMWAGMCEFSKKEQLSILSQLSSYLDINGYLIFDMISVNCETIQAVKLDENNYVIHTKFGDDFIYLPSTKEIENYVEKLNLQIVEKIIYTTKTNKERCLYIVAYL